MEYETIADNEWITIRYNKTDNYIHHVMHNYNNSEAIMESFNAALAFLAENKIEKWLSDDRKNVNFSVDELRVNAEAWGPHAAAAGWKFWALVVPESITGRANMIDVVNAWSELGIHILTFTTVEEAQEWLVKM